MDKPTPRIKPCFRDDKQKEYNRLLTELECKVLATAYDRDYFEGDLQMKIKSLVSTEEGWLRLIQAIVELTGKLATNEQIFNVHYWLFHSLPLTNPTPTRLLELISQYVKMRAQCQCSSGITFKQRNLCIALNIVTNRVKDFEKAKLMTKEIVSFLNKILHQSDDSNSDCLLYALSCLSTFLVNKENQMKILKEIELIAMLKQHQDNLDLYTLQTFYIAKFDYFYYQIGFLARWCLDLIEGCSSAKPNEIDSKSSFDPNDCTSGLKLSPDQLSVRNDGYTQRVRAAYPVTCGAFYYEVILLTSESISVGWTTKKSNLQNSLSNYSILFNGYENRIFGDINYDTKVRSSQAGDIIGCMIDAPNGKFMFYLNGELVINQLSVPFSNEPYFAVIELTTAQHCYCNFGQVAFKYPRSTITYRTFHESITKYVNDMLCPFCNVKTKCARFANCDHWIVCLECMNKLKKCPTCNQ